MSRPEPTFVKGAPTFGQRVVEAAPARRRIMALAAAALAGFAVLGARAVVLAVEGAPARSAATARSDVVVRGDLVDRRGVLLAVSAPSFHLTADPTKVWDATEAARSIAKVLPNLDREGLERRLRQSDKRHVILARDLTPRQREAVFALGLAGLDFEATQRRVYPQGRLAAHVLGQVDQKRVGVAGLEAGLDGAIRRAGASGQPLRLSLDVRFQHALEAELAIMGAQTTAQYGAGIVMDARTGEVLALASWPDFDPNAPPPVDAEVRINRATGAVYEMGSTIKPFTVAAGLDAGLTSTDERFDLAQTLDVGGFVVRDMTPYPGTLALPQALARSSNIAVAEIALRLGPQRQRQSLERLGLLERAALPLPESAKPLAAARQDALSTAVLGYGHGMAVSVAALAGAYTVFANDGSRVTPTLLAVAVGDPVQTMPVFSPEAAVATRAMLRMAVTEGTGKRADVPGLAIAGKTGTAEKLGVAGYEQSRNFASFAAVFPAHAPRYVMVVALDEPSVGAEAGAAATGGGAAAPLAARLARRIAPFVSIEPIPALAQEASVGVAPGPDAQSAEPAQGGGVGP